MKLGSAAMAVPRGATRGGKPVAVPPAPTPAARCSQRGYLMEVPLILMAVGVAVAILFQILPPIGQKILLVLALVPVLLALYYMIVIPGWTPNAAGRLRAPWNLLVFVLVAIVLLAGVGLVVFG